MLEDDRAEPMLAWNNRMDSDDKMTKYVIDDEQLKELRSAAYAKEPFMTRHILLEVRQQTLEAELQKEREKILLAFAEWDNTHWTTQMVGEYIELLQGGRCHK